MMYYLSRHTSRRPLSRLVLITLLTIFTISSTLVLHSLLPSSPQFNSYSSALNSLHPLPSSGAHSTSYNSAFGHLNETSGSSRFAIATFLTGSPENPDDGKDPDADPYYIATRVITYHILHAPETRCNKSISFIVMVTSTVSESAKQQLRLDGANVVEVEDVPLPSWIKTGVTRWKDVFTKLRVFEIIEYDRILFIDADTLIQSKIDGIFHEPEVQRPDKTLFSRPRNTDELPLPENYVFAARSDNGLTGERNHPFPPLHSQFFSSGFLMIAPSPALFEYFLSAMSHKNRFDAHIMEQSLYNYAFRRNGPMPWRELHYKWSATWPNLEDVGAGVVTLHEKFWRTGPPELQRLWRLQKDAMERYYASPAK